MTIKVTVYNERNSKAWSATFFDDITTMAIWLDYCLNELRLRLIQGFTITLAER